MSNARYPLFVGFSDQYQSGGFRVAFDDDHTAFRVELTKFDSEREHNIEIWLSRIQMANFLRAGFAAYAAVEQGRSR